MLEQFRNLPTQPMAFIFPLPVTAGSVLQPPHVKLQSWHCLGCSLDASYFYFSILSFTSTSFHA